MATQDEVEEFLLKARELISTGNALLVTRPKNIEALARLAMTTRAAIADVAQLTAQCYCRGPEADRDRPGQDCWFFGTEVNGTEVYIKLIVQSLAGGRERLAVISYHEAERPLRYALK